MRRFLDEEGAWESHLQKTRQCILNELYRLKPQSVAVLGSGWLLDIPLQELLAEGASVKLIDIAHPSRIKHKYRGNPRVEFIDYDLTRAVDNVLNYKDVTDSSAFRELILSLKQPVHNLNFEADLCISVNTLSQLHVLYADYLSRRKSFSGNSREELAKAIQLAHLDFLPKGKSLLVSDFEEELYDEDGKLMGVNPRLFVDLNRYEKVDSWSWSFDSRKTYHQNYLVKLNVISFRV
jgi:hypothetical protein